MGWNIELPNMSVLLPHVWWLCSQMNLSQVRDSANQHKAWLDAELTALQGWLSPWQSALLVGTIIDVHSLVVCFLLSSTP